MPGDTSYYDPNDPNMGSQADSQQRQSADRDVFLSFSQTLNDLPAYRDWLTRNANGGDLTDVQKAELRALVQAEGLSIPPGMDIDKTGAILPVDRTTRNWLIAAGIAALPFAVQGIVAAAGAGGAGSAAGMSAPTMGGGSTVAANLGAASALPAATAPVAGAAGAGSVTAAVQGTEAGIYGGSATTPAATTPSNPSLLSRVGKAITGNRGSNLLGAAGEMINAGTQAAGQNRTDAFEATTRANNAYENQLMARSRDEQTQRATALKDVYRASWYANRQASPNNTRGLTAISPEMQATLDALKVQGAEKLKSKAQYDSNGNPVLEKPTPSQPGLLERVGTYAGPIASGLSAVSRIMRGK